MNACNAPGSGLDLNIFNTCPNCFLFLIHKELHQGVSFGYPAAYNTIYCDVPGILYVLTITTMVF